MTTKKITVKEAREIVEKESKIYLPSDGYRLHREIGTPYTGELYERANNAGLLHAPNENMATIQAVDLLQVVKRSKKLNKGNLTLSINGTCEVMTSQHGSHSEFSISENYQHEGENYAGLFDPQYLIDALSGMQGEIIISMDTKYQYSPIFITDGKREAVIMPQKG